MAREETLARPQPDVGPKSPSRRQSSTAQSIQKTLPPSYQAFSHRNIPWLSLQCTHRARTGNSRAVPGSWYDTRDVPKKYGHCRAWYHLSMNRSMWKWGGKGCRDCKIFLRYSSRAALFEPPPELPPPPVPPACPPAGYVFGLPKITPPLPPPPRLCRGNVWDSADPRARRDSC